MDIGFAATKSAITTAQTSTKNVTRTFYAKSWSFPTNTIFHPAHVAGLFFFLASAEGAGLFFCPAAIQPHTSVYSVFCAVNAANYTANATKQHTRLCRLFSGDCARSTAHDNRPAQAAITPPVPRWSVSQRPDGLHRYQIPPPRRTLYRSAQPPYYNKVYKGATVRPCYRSMPDGATHRRPCQPGGVSSCRLQIANKC